MAKRKRPSGRRDCTSQGHRADQGRRAAKDAPRSKAAVGVTPAGGGSGNIRDSIDSIDARIHALLNERARFAQLVGISKSASGKAVDFYRPEREAEVLRMALKRNQGPLRDEEIARLFREIMSACLAQQEPLKVAFLGPEGTFTQAAVLKHFGSSVRALPLPAIDEVFHEVEGGVADFGVVPIENSSEGTVNHTLDMFLSSALKICGEVELRINHYLMGKMSDTDAVKRVCAHPQALAQCRGGWTISFRMSERVGVSSNAEGARRARDERGTAAIASRAAAEIYGLNSARQRDRGSVGQHHPLFGGGQKAVQRQRRRSHHAAGIRRRYRRFRRAVPLARASRAASRQHDAHRIAALAQAQVGLCVFHRHRRACQRPAGGQGARCARGAASLFKVLGSYPRAVL